MKKWLMTLMVLLAMCGVARAEPLVIDGGTADKVHLRASPVETASSLGLYYTGTPVERLATTGGGWSRVRIGSETGYVRTEYLAGKAEDAFVPSVVDNRTSDWVNLRSGASFEADPVARLDNGTSLRLMGETASGWSYVVANGRRGYVVTDFVSPAGNAVPTPGASAAPDAGQTMIPRIVGTTAEGYIHALDAGNGQTLYFTAAEADPAVTREDVNFDGRADLVIATVRGATNCYYEFFVWTEAGYLRAEYPGADGIANYVLYPEGRYVKSSANAGNAGALFEDCLYRWEGNCLRLIRRAQSQSWREYRAEGSSFVIVMHDRKAELTVYGYSDSGESTLIHEEIVDLNAMDASRLDAMKQHLWTGLR